MSLDNAKTFLQKADADTALRSKVDGMQGDTSAIVDLAATMGFAFTANDLLTAQDELYGDLSDDELAGAAGGTIGIKQEVPKNP